MALNQTVAPTVEPITLAEAKRYLRVTHTEDDVDIESWLIPSARLWCEVFTCRAFVNQTWQLTLDGFDGCDIVLPRPPLSSFTSIAYLDGDGVSQTWDSSKYTVVTPSGDHAPHAHITTAYQEEYPSTRDVPESVTLTYVAGYGAAATDVPMAIRQAIRVRCDYEYSHSASAQEAAEALLWPFRACRPDIRFR